MSSYLHCLVTRFSFRFRKDDPILPLLSDQRLDERVRIFSKYCFPSITNQINKNFYWILIVDPLLPSKYQKDLTALIDNFKASELYQTRGPREIWLHTWDYENNLGEIDWILPHFEQKWQKDRQTSRNHKEPNWKPPTYLVTTRLDDDDSLTENFTEMIRLQLRKPPRITDFRYLSYAVGYQFDSKRLTLRRSRIPMIALGLTLIAKIDRYPICAYLGNHTKIPNFIRKPSINKIMNKYCLKNKDLPITKQKVIERLKVFRGGEAVYLRNVHDFNLQKNINRRQIKPQDKNKVKSVIKNRFHVQV